MSLQHSHASSPSTPPRRSTHSKENRHHPLRNQIYPPPSPKAFPSSVSPFAIHDVTVSPRSIWSNGDSSCFPSPLALPGSILHQTPSPQRAQSMASKEGVRRRVTSELNPSAAAFVPIRAPVLHPRGPPNPASAWRLPNTVAPFEPFTGQDAAADEFEDLSSWIAAGMQDDPALERELLDARGSFADQLTGSLSAVKKSRRSGGARDKYNGRRQRTTSFDASASYTEVPPATSTLGTFSVPLMKPGSWMP